MAVTDLHDKFVYDLQEMYYIENRLVDVLDDLAMDAANEELGEGFREHREQTREHVTRLEDVFRAIDEPPEQRSSPVFDALLTEREQFLEEAGGDEDLRDLYDLGAGVKNEHLEIAGYEGLIQTARKLDLSREVTNALNQNLDEEQETKKQLKMLGEDSTLRKVFARLAG